jgi:FixJ family two-component response regulator
MNSSLPVINDAASTPPCVLVVDDEAAITEEITDWLTMLGIACYSAANASKAMTILAADPAITVLLTDLHMPDTNGITLSTDALTTRTDENALEIVVLTAHATRDFAVDALRARVMDFVPKPATFTVLRVALDRAHANAANRRRRHREATALVASLQSSIKVLETAAANVNGPSPFGNSAPGADVRTSALASIGHEVLSALHQIVGFAELIGLNPAALQPDDLREYTQALLTAGTNLSEHTRMLLQFLEASAVPRSTRPAPHDLAKLFGDLTRSYQACLNDRRQSIQLDCPANLIIETDGELLEQTLRYLLSASLRFGPDEATIVLGARPDAGAVRIFVIEAPAGADVTPILGGSHRAPDTVPAFTFRRDGEGVGIGISTFQAARLGGRLDVEVHSNGISVATLTLPAIRTAKAPVAEFHQ